MDDLDALRDELETVRAESARLAERLAGQEGRTREIETAAAELRRNLDTAHIDRRAAMSRYREAVLAGSPELPADLVTGDTLDQIDTTVRAARELVARVREHVAADAAPTVPAGSPPRRGPDAGAMSAAEKIRYGIGHRS